MKNFATFKPDLPPPNWLGSASWKSVYAGQEELRFILRRFIMTDLIFYTHPMSRGRIVRWMLEEVGQPYETLTLGYDTSMKSPEYLAINPMGKVPAIKHGETVVTEGAAICAYLADAFPQKNLAPPHGDPRRGPYYRWMFFAAGPIEAAITGKALGLLAPE